MDIIFGIGQIGDGSMAPKETIHNNKAFRRCGVFVEDPFGEPVKNERGEDILGYNGKPQRKRKTYQLVFPSDENGGNVFNNLNPGRKIFFIGRASTRERAIEWDGKSTRKEILTVGNKKVIAFANVTVHVMRIEFIDPALNFTLSRYKEAAVKQGFSEEQAEAFVDAVRNGLTNSKPNNEETNKSNENQVVPPSNNGDDENIPF